MAGWYKLLTGRALDLVGECRRTALHAVLLHPGDVQWQLSLMRDQERDVRVWEDGAACAAFAFSDSTTGNVQWLAHARAPRLGAAALTWALRHLRSVGIGMAHAAVPDDDAAATRDLEANGFVSESVLHGSGRTGAGVSSVVSGEVNPRRHASGCRSQLAQCAAVSAAVVLMCSCAASGSSRPTPHRASPGIGPSVTTPSAIATARTISLAAIQRLDSRVGFVSGWTGTGLGLAETSDAGATWRRTAIPASRITALRFIDKRVGWAGALVGRDMPGVACQQAPPTAMPPCRGVILRTGDGGRTWQETLSIVTDEVQGDPIRQLQAVDGERAWALTLPPSPCPDVCPTELRRTTDGGRTWTTLLQGRIAAIRFASADRGWLAITSTTGALDVRVTSDGGATWVDGLHTTTGQAVGLDAAGTQVVWVMTQDGAYCTASTCSKYELFRTVDGGLNWSSLGNPKPAAGNCFFGHLVGPTFASPNRGWLALTLGAGGVQGGPGGLLSTEDRGGDLALHEHTAQHRPRERRRSTRRLGGQRGPRDRGHDALLDGGRRRYMASAGPDFAAVVHRLVALAAELRPGPWRGSGPRARPTRMAEMMIE
jgi:hypothetical protein